MLSQEQRDRFASEGFVVVSEVCAEELLAAVDDEVDGVMADDPPGQDVTGTHFYFLPPSTLPSADAALRQSDALALAHELTAPHQLVHGYGHIQVALNIPSWEHTPAGPHLDGFHDPERPFPFSLLGCIFLGDESAPSAGNLWVWPGSHLSHAEMFETRGVHVLKESGGHSTLAQPPLDLGEPVPVLAKRGDLLLAHYLLGHNSGGNTGAATRRAVYYRLASADLETRWEASLADPFLEYPDLRRSRSPGKRTMSQSGRTPSERTPDAQCSENR